MNRDQWDQLSGEYWLLNPSTGKRFHQFYPYCSLQTIDSVFGTENVCLRHVNALLFIATLHSSSFDLGQCSRSPKAVVFEFKFEFESQLTTFLLKRYSNHGLLINID